MSSNRETPPPPPTHRSRPPPPPGTPSPNHGSDPSLPPPLPTSHGSGPPPPTTHGSGPPPAAGVVAKSLNEGLLEIDVEEERRLSKKRKEREDKTYAELSSQDQKRVDGVLNHGLLFPIMLDMSQYPDMETQGEHDRSNFWIAYQHMKARALDGTSESKVIYEPTLHEELKSKLEGDVNEVQEFLRYMHKLKLEDTKYEQVDPDGKKWFPRLRRGKDMHGTYFCWYEKGSRDQYLQPPNIMPPS